MLLAYPCCFILSLNSDTVSGVRGGDDHLRRGLRKSAKDLALKNIVCLITGLGHICND